MPLDFDDSSEQKSFMDFLFDNISSAIFIVDENLKIKNINSAFSSLFSKHEQDAINKLCGNGLSCIFAVTEDKPCGTTSRCEECDLRNSLKQGFEEKDNVHQCMLTREFVIDGKPVLKHFKIKAKYAKYKDEGIGVVVIDDMTEIEQQKEQLRELATRDYLTGMYNRRYFFEVAEKFYENARRQNISLALVMIDIDHFKSVNDTYGHDAGDVVLKGIASMFSDFTRKADIVARFGGEEFCLMLTSVDAGQAYAVVEKLRERIMNESFKYDGHEIKVSISSGIATVLDNRIGDMIKNADRLLYEAKRAGRNRTLCQGL